VPAHPGSSSSSSSSSSSGSSGSGSDDGSGGSTGLAPLDAAGIFARAMELDAGAASSSSPQAPLFTVPLSAAPGGCRTAVAKARPGVFRLLVAAGDDAGSGAGAGSVAGTESGGEEDEGEAGGVALPPSLLWASALLLGPRLAASTLSPRDSVDAEGPVEAILVAVGSDEDADGAAVAISVSLFIYTSQCLFFISIFLKLLLPVTSG
jgi:hypothetical protein